VARAKRGRIESRERSEGGEHPLLPKKPFHPWAAASPNSADPFTFRCLRHLRETQFRLTA
jgi:hypothetical protein